jgi:hypothetical protein
MRCSRTRDIIHGVRQWRVDSITVGIPFVSFRDDLWFGVNDLYRGRNIEYILKWVICWVFGVWVVYEGVSPLKMSSYISLDTFRVDNASLNGYTCDSYMKRLFRRHGNSRGILHAN